MDYQEQPQYNCQLHPNEQIQFICYEANCRAVSKLGCEDCFTDNQAHDEHKSFTFKMALPKILKQIESSQISSHEINQLISTVQETEKKIIKNLKVQCEKTVHMLELIKPYASNDINEIRRLNDQLKNKRSPDVLQEIAAFLKNKSAFVDVLLSEPQAKSEDQIENARKNLQKFQQKHEVIFMDIQECINRLQGSQIQYLQQSGQKQSSELDKIQMEVFKKHEGLEGYIQHIQELIGQDTIAIYVYNVKELKFYSMIDGSFKYKIVIPEYLSCLAQIRSQDLILGGDNGNIYKFNFQNKTCHKIHQLENKQGITKIVLLDSLYDKILVMALNSIILLQKIKEEQYKEVLYYQVEENQTIYPNTVKNNCVLDTFDENKLGNSCFITRLKKPDNSCQINCYQMNQTQVIGSIKSTDYIWDYFVDSKGQLLYLVKTKTIEIHSYSITTDPNSGHKKTIFNHQSTLKDSSMNSTQLQLKVFKCQNYTRMLLATMDSLIIYEVEQQRITQEKHIELKKENVLKREYLHSKQIDHMIYSKEHNMIVYGTKDRDLLLIE